MSDKDKQILLSLLETISKIFQYTADLTGSDDFEKDNESFDATMMNFIILGELVSKLSDQFKDTHPEIDWRKICAFRNVLAHDYFGIFPAEVWEIITRYLPELNQEISLIVQGQD